MVVETTVTRTARFAVGDMVDVYSNADSIKEFKEHQPLIILKVGVDTKSSPYTFSYFVENCRGEREYFTERSLVGLYHYDGEYIAIDEKVFAKSEFEEGDNVIWLNDIYGHHSGKVVKVIAKKNRNEIPFFEYLVEHSDFSRRIGMERQLSKDDY